MDNKIHLPIVNKYKYSEEIDPAVSSFSRKDLLKIIIVIVNIRINTNINVKNNDNNLWYKKDLDSLIW